MPMNSADFAEHQLWAVYAWWTCILILKMFTLTWFTGRIRVARQVIHSEEDKMWMKGPNILLAPTGDGHPDVERIRSAHQCDLEIALPFLLITPLWLNTSPSFFIARIILPCFAILSISYTVVHMQLVETKQCLKSAIFLLKVCILIYVSAGIIMHHAN